MKERLQDEANDRAAGKPLALKSNRRLVSADLVDNWESRSPAEVRVQPSSSRMGNSNGTRGRGGDGKV